MSPPPTWIARIRKNTIIEIFNRLKILISYLQELCGENPSADLPRFCRSRNCGYVSNAACHALSLGLESTYSASICHLIRDISNFRAHRPSLYEAIYYHSAGCDPIPDFGREIGKLVHFPPNRSLHLARMKTQREKLGIDYD